MATFYNQATLSYKGRTVSSNVASGEIVSNLSVSKTAVTDVYSPGDELVYVVTIVNSGTNPLSGLTVTDDLGEYAFGEETLVPLTYVDGSVKYFIDGVLQPAPTVSEVSPLTVSGISVPADGTIMLIYAAGVNSFAPPEVGGSITNTATVSGIGISGLAASETVNAAAESNLDIAKSVCPTTVSENDEVTYTFVITNSGCAEAGIADSVSVEDIFSPILRNISVSYNGAQIEKITGYTYDESTGEFATVAGEITVPAAAYTQDPVTGEWTGEPGSVTLTVSGTI